MMLFSITCVVLLNHAVHTMHGHRMGPIPPFKLSNVKHIELDELSKFNDFVTFQQSFFEQPTTTLYNSHHLPNTCAFLIQRKSVSFIGWEIDCILPISEQTYTTCASGSISLQDGEAIDVTLGLLAGKGKSEYCAAGKDSLAAIDQLVGLIPSGKKKKIILYDMSIVKVLNFKSLDRKPLKIRSTLFAVLLSSEFFSPSQVPTLGYYGKYGYILDPEAVIEITEAIEILYSITVAEVQQLLDSKQIDNIPVLRVKVNEALKRNTKNIDFVGLIKNLYRKAIELSEKKEFQEIEELKQTVDDIVCCLDFLKEVRVGDIQRAVSVLRRGKWMSKTIQ